MSIITDKVFQTSGKNNIQLKYSTSSGSGQGVILSKILCDLIKRKNTRKFKNCLDWCSGPGFIGFELLDHGVCDNLTLMDFYAPFISMAKQTIKTHNLNNVKAHTCNKLGLLSKQNKFDLIVGNPPWANNYNLKNNEILIITEDKNWETHKEFFTEAKSYLSNDGTIYLIEGSDFSSPETFIPFIEQNNLKLLEVHTFQEYPKIYVMEIK